MAEAPGGMADSAAYNLYLQGREIDYTKSPAEAAALFRQVVALDTDFGQAWAELAWVYWTAFGNKGSEKTLGAISNEEMTSRIRELLKEAAKRPSPTYYHLTSEISLSLHRYEDAISAAERAIALDPSDYLAMNI
jgi:tetratricopeptide (TPR) repeat protein